MGPGSDIANAMAIQPDDKIVVAGDCYNDGGTGYDFCVARFTPSGSFDATFGSSGRVRLPIGTSNDYANALAILSDGRILLAGHCFDASSSNYKFCLARVLADGSVDSNFGSYGRVVTPIGISHAHINSIVVDRDGKVFAGGSCIIAGSNTTFCVARYLSDGALDSSFGVGGRVTIPVSSANAKISAVAVDNDGRYVSTGLCASTGSSITRFCTIRILSTGELDSTFGSAGLISTSISDVQNDAGSVSFFPDGSILVVGDCYNAATGWQTVCGAKYGTDGAFDSQFGAGGKMLLASVSIEVKPYAHALQPDGRVLIAGQCHGEDFFFEFCVVRLRTDGSLDTEFGTKGQVRISRGGNDDIGTGIALQRDGRIVAAGTCSNGDNLFDFCLARFHGGPYAFRACSQDIDGDGIVSATTDILILARVALGLRGDSVLSGIAFPGNAARTTWSSILGFLSLHCGLTL